ncbi:DUF2194 domain-containing protein [Mesobacillus subterraneus]|uniref:DUF2194 domain-containing protein n=1 Tax=Mesobacillus subterraneus TaxID=285983 RepID=UPI001CFC5187|nr:DUF2194 domain-containing protein [Mesobacillus subterraneus]WLR54469.1 DUF2194 domain-containing protein [Mesobacillus subterraneus]
MKEKFAIHASVKAIVGFVFVFGLVLSVFQTDFILLLNSQKGPVVNAPNEEKRLSEEELSEAKKEKVLILTNSNNEDSVKMADNLAQTLTYMKKDWEVVPFTNTPQELNGYETIVIAFSMIDQMDRFNELMDYAANGGSVFFAIRPEIGSQLYQIYRKLGINEIGDYELTEGVKVNSSVLFGAKGMEFQGGFFTNSSLSLSLQQDLDVLLETGEGIPLLWKQDFEKGRFIFFNGSSLGSKDNRGIIAAAMSLTKENYAYPVLNAKVAFIDDFPAPFPEGNHPLIQKEFQMKTKDFYQRVWWADIQKGGAKYDVVYSSAMIQTYQNNVEPPFSLELHNTKNLLIRYGRDLLKMDGEIGFHGYNHQSLTLNENDVKDLGYKVWKSQSAMEESLKTLDSYSEELYPGYEQNLYVPPSNIISKEGLQAIKKALPNVGIIASLYLPSEENKSFTQEFIADEDFIHLPRITSGYVIQDNQYWSLINSLNSVGVFSHFIHPDDVLDPDRRFNRTYEKMNENYQNFLKYLYKKHAWLRPMIASQAGQEISEYWKTQTYIMDTENGMTIYNDFVAGDLTFIVRSENGISSVTNGTYKEIDEHVYAITTDSAKTTVEFRRTP